MLARFALTIAMRCGEAELWLFVGFLLFCTLYRKPSEFHQKSPESQHQFTIISPEYRIGAL